MLRQRLIWQLARGPAGGKQARCFVTQHITEFLAGCGRQFSRAARRVVAHIRGRDIAAIRRHTGIRHRAKQRDRAAVVSGGHRDSQIVAERRGFRAGAAAGNGDDVHARPERPGKRDSPMTAPGRNGIGGNHAVDLDRNQRERRRAALDDSIGIFVETKAGVARLDGIARTEAGKLQSVWRAAWQRSAWHTRHGRARQQAMRERRTIVVGRSTRRNQRNTE